MKRIAGHVVRHHVESGHQITRVVGGKLTLTPAYVRNNFFFADVTAQLAPRVTLFTSYRINDDNGQGSRLAEPVGTPGFLISSYPNTYQSPEARLAVRLHRRLDWNVGYQYYNYNESAIVGPRPQNYLSLIHISEPTRLLSSS